MQLHYVRTTDGREVDFVLANAAAEAIQFIEVKVGDTKPALLLRKVAAEHPHAIATQLVLRAPHAFDVDGVGIRPAAPWLMNLAA